MTRVTVPESAGSTSPLESYLAVLKAHWLKTLAVFVVTVAAAVVFTSMQTPVYQSSATVLIEPEPPRVVNIPEVSTEAGGSSQDYYATQYKILESRRVVDAVIEQLNLKKRMPRVGHAKDPYAALVYSRNGLAISPIKNTRLVLVQFDDPDPVLATEIANGIATQYVKYNLATKHQEAQIATEWLTDQIQSLRTKAQQSSRALHSYQAKADLLGLQDQRQLTQAKLIDFNRAYLEAQNQRLATESKLRELSRIAKDPGSLETLSIVANDPLIQKLKTEASDLQIERSKLAEIYRPKHPDLQQIDAQIREVTQRLQTEVQKMIRGLETEYKVAKAREETLLGNMNELRREARALSEREAQATSLQREKDTVDELQATVLKRLKETGLTSALTVSNIRVVEPATVPQFPIRPKSRLIWALSAICGLALGVGVAFVADSLDNRVRLPDEIERVLGVPVVGLVPAFQSKPK